MKISKKSSKGYVAVDATLGIAIFIILSTLVITVLLNIYNINLSSHRLAMATNYAVEILENAKSLNYYDSKLNDGNYESKELLGVTLGENYIAKLNIIDYNKIEGNESKENVIKVLELNIEYQEGKLTKNVKINTLKINNDFKV